MTDRQVNTLIIIDDQFEKIEGHPYEYNKSVRQIFRQNGFNTIIYGNGNLSTALQEELNAHAWFRFHPQNSIRRIPLIGPVLYRISFWRKYRQQMTALLKKLAEEHKNYFVFVPNVYWYNVLPVLKSLHKAGVPSGILYRLSILDTVQIPAVMKPLILPLIRYSVNLARDSKQIHYFTDSDVIASEWEAYFHLPMNVLPIPHLTPLHPVPHNTSRGKEKIRLYLPGGMRIEKGAQLLVEGMEILAAAHKDILEQVTLITQFTGNNEVLNQYKARLAALPVDNNFLGNLSTEEYNLNIQTADVILIPYQVSEGYRARTSGILAEAVAAQKPFITTDGTWMAVQAKKYDTGIVIAETPRAFAESIVAMISGYSHFAAKADAAATAWLRFHSKDNFFKQLSTIFTGTDIATDGK